jgi:membrane-associated protein
MEFIKYVFDFILHIDEHLGTLLQQYGPWVNGILFAIIFVETGLVIWPWLPGDSLLFAAGFFASRGDLNVWVLFALLSFAAVLGDTVNYWIGHYLGPRVFKFKKSRWFNPDHLRKAHAFYEKYGGKTIIIARFVPIVRTFAPFVAGVGAMTYPKFIAYNVIGGVGWVGLLLAAGYHFGRIPWVQENFETVIYVIILVSVLPMVIEYLRHRAGAKRPSARR